MHDNGRAIPRVDVVGVDCPGGIARAFRKETCLKEEEADLTQRGLVQARNETTKSIHSESFIWAHTESLRLSFH